jgi:hypothetical protein
MKGKKYSSLFEGVNIWNYISRLHPEAVKKYPNNPVNPVGKSF